MTGPLSVQPLTQEDFPACAALAGRVLDQESDEPTVSMWHWRFERNPARTDDIALGWVLRRSEGAPVGVLANLPQRFWIDGQDVLSCATSHYAVDEYHRGQGLALAQAFIRQPGPALLLDTTANPGAAALFRRLGFQPVDGWEQVFVWVLDPIQVAAALTLGRSPRLAGLVPHFVAPVPTPVLPPLRGRRLSASATRVREVAEIDDRFDRLWHQLRDHFGTTAVRTSAFLRWRLRECPLPRRRCRVLVAEGSSGELTGFVAWRRFDVRRGELPRARIVDLFCSPTRLDVIRALLGAALQQARTEGAAVLEVAHAGNQMRSQLRALGGRTRISYSSAYLVRVPLCRDPGAAVLKSWDTSSVDGDFGM